VYLLPFVTVTSAEERKIEVNFKKRKKLEKNTKKEAMRM
jgi:hypothetical protein